jgi:CBS domain containing-hemolysin-like protein
LTILADGVAGLVVVVVVPAELDPQAASTRATVATAVPIAAILVNFRWILMPDLLGLVLDCASDAS